MHKLKISRQLFLILLVFALVGCGYFALRYWQNNRTIPDFIPALEQLKDDVNPGKNPITVVAAGDLVCNSKSLHYNFGNGTPGQCHMKATADLARRLNPALVLVLGDLQYNEGELKEFQTAYAASWGVDDIKSITRPVAGNHEYETKNAQGYYDYFGSAAGDPSKGYYSFDKEDWHFVALNSNCEIVACDAGSEQQKWLEKDLANHAGKCTLAYWHHPLFSSGSHGSDGRTKALYQTLAQAKAEIVLAGHDHLYERFAPQNADAISDPAGIRSFIVGTGGKSLYPFRDLKTNSQVRISSSYGVLKLQLSKDSYTWQFIDENNKVLDQGNDTCRS